ncbi:hypothetical protein DNTS_013548 [Danionella cerebrum]|uniref:Uncharacterized protein n=1 Tax=Danionella cerebrum TaxID=2873325 RepID=A0A553RDZ7_9TELE|nr:hypothetical protein DNTS_013548 [Danionella translucida]
MEARDFSAPAHLLSERSVVAQRTASRASSAGHGSAQHPPPHPHFTAGKYYPSHLPMAAHSVSAGYSTTGGSETCLNAKLN